MKIGEAQKAYRQQISLLRGQKRDFVEQQKENREKMEQARKKSEEQGVTFELSEAFLEREKELQEKIDELTGQIKNNEKTLDDLIEQEVGIFNSVVAEQQGDAWKEYGEEMAKCLEIARRISRGDHVPAQDEEKLMEVIDSYDGVLPFSDKASPEVIRRETGMSKNEFKRALGGLYRQRRVEIGEESVRKVK